jgi:hypothetical protein
LHSVGCADPGVPVAPGRGDGRRYLPSTGRDEPPRDVNIFERWESQAALETFRSSGPDTEQRPAMLTVSVQEYDIADVRPVFGKEAE